MIYAVSDIHGCYDKYRDLMKKLNLGSDDTLYVLGDVIDRGADGFKILLDMAQRPNVVNLLGNHEAMALDALPRLMNAIEENGEATLTGEDAEAVELWFYNGGELSLADFLWLNNEQEQTVLAYMRDMPLYKEVEAGERRFVLVHGGLCWYMGVCGTSRPPVLWRTTSRMRFYGAARRRTRPITPTSMWCSGIRLFSLWRPKPRRRSIGRTT